MNDDPVSRGEFELLRQIVTAAQARIETIDLSGTRGVGAVQVRLDDLVKDVVELRTTVDTRFEAVDAKFERQRLERVTARRWTVGAVIAGVGSMGAVITLLVQILQNVH